MVRQLSGTPGSIDKKTFKEGVSSLIFEDDTFVDRVFTLLDDDHGGTIDWEEFVQTVNALETGSPHDKLAFCFQVPKLDPKLDPKPGPKPDPKPDLSLTPSLILSLTLTLTLSSPSASRCTTPTATIRSSATSCTKCSRRCCRGG